MENDGERVRESGTSSSCPPLSFLGIFSSGDSCLSPFSSSFSSSFKNRPQVLDSYSSMCEPALRGHCAHVLPNFVLSMLAVVAPTNGHAHPASGGPIVPAGADAQPTVHQAQQRQNSPVHNYAFLTGVTSGWISAISRSLLVRDNGFNM